jgi:hypothetical protein
MTITEIRAIVEQESEINISDKCRELRSVTARAIYCLLSRKLTGATYKHIGDLINRNHASVVNLERKATSFIKTEIDYKNLYLKVMGVIDFTPESKEEDVKVVEKIVYRDFNEGLTDNQKVVLKALKNLDDSDTLDFINNRLNPFCAMLKSKKTHNIDVVAGAHRSFTIQNV